MNAWVCVQMWQLVSAACAATFGGMGLFLFLFGVDRKSRFVGLVAMLIAGAGIACSFAFTATAGGG